MATLASATLSQRKLVTASSTYFHVQEAVVASHGSVSTPFLITAAGTLPETMTIAAYTDITGGVYNVNPMTRFHVPGVDFRDAVYGTLLNRSLVITVPPEEWAGNTAPVTLAVNGVFSDDGSLQMVLPFWTKVTGLNWTLLPTATDPVLRAGSNGSTLRADTTQVTFLDMQFQSTFQGANDALVHIAYTQTAYKQIVEQANVDAAAYIASAPGNPILSTY